MLNVDSEQEIREAVENNEYVALSYVRELLDEVDRLRKLAYIGEHHFSDLTYKARLEETVRDLRETQAQLENTLDATKEGSWMARALDAERHRAVLKDQLKYAESYMEKQILAVKQDAKDAIRMERSRIGYYLRTASRAQGVLINIQSGQDIARLASDIEQGRHVLEPNT